MILAKEQRIGAAILIGIALIGWIVVAVWPSRQPVPAPEPAPQKKHRTWEDQNHQVRHENAFYITDLQSL